MSRQLTIYANKQYEKTVTLSRNEDEQEVFERLVAEDPESADGWDFTGWDDEYEMEEDD